MSQWIHEFEGLGPVTFKTAPRAKSLRLRVRSGRVSVSLPEGLGPEAAHRWVSQHAVWAREQLARQTDLREQHARAGLLVGPVADRAQAHQLLNARLSELAARHGLSYKRLRVREQKSRWGSCSAAGNINLNCRLVNLPAELRDYVILHELAHTRVPNHSAAFWAELAGLVAEPRALDRRLRQYRLD